VAVEEKLRVRSRVARYADGRAVLDGAISGRGLTDDEALLIFGADSAGVAVAGEYSLSEGVSAPLAAVLCLEVRDAVRRLAEALIRFRRTVWLLAVVAGAGFGRGGWHGRVRF